MSNSMGSEHLAVIKVVGVGGGLLGTVAYASSKAGMNGFTKAIAKEGGKYGISCNAVCPSFTITDMTTALSNDEEKYKKVVGIIPLGRPAQASEGKTLAQLKESIVVPDDERIFDLAEMIRRGYKLEMISTITGVDEWFLNKFKWIVDQEEKLRVMKIEDLNKEYLLELKKKGFSDKGMADLMKIDTEDLVELRKLYKIRPSYKMVDTCAGEFDAISPYYYSTYEEYDEVEISDKKKVIVLGSGPIRIGQGIEFDYCSVHAVIALRKLGIETIIINNNPETVSTDFDLHYNMFLFKLKTQSSLLFSSLFTLQYVSI